MAERLAINPDPRCRLRNSRGGNNGPQLLQPSMKRSWSPRDLWTLVGTNWVWAEWLAIYHAIFSITIPIFLVELTFPQSKTRIWLSTKMRTLFHGLLVLAIILGFFAFPYDPGVLAIAGCIATVIALGWLAKRIPNISPTKRSLKVSWKIL